MKKLYVGNLPRSVRDDDLRDIFQEYGVASSKVITDRDSGQSRGFGFVEIEDDEVALRAIEEKNGFDVDGYALVVNEARPPERKPFGGGGERRFGGGGGGPRRSGGGGFSRDRGGFGGGDRGGRGGDRGGRGNGGRSGRGEW